MCEQAPSPKESTVAATAKYFILRFHPVDDVRSGRIGRVARNVRGFMSNLAISRARD